MNLLTALTRRQKTTPSKWLDFRFFCRPFFGQYGIEVANTVPGFMPPMDYKVTADLKRLNSIDFEEVGSRNRFALLASFLMRDAGDYTVADFCTNLAALPDSLFKPFAQAFLYQLNSTIVERYANEIDESAPDFVISFVENNKEKIQ